MILAIFWWNFTGQKRSIVKCSMKRCSNKNHFQTNFFGQCGDFTLNMREICVEHFPALSKTPDLTNSYWNYCISPMKFCRAAAVNMTPLLCCISSIGDLQHLEMSHISFRMEYSVISDMNFLFFLITVHFWKNQIS